MLIYEAFKPANLLLCQRGTYASLGSPKAVGGPQNHMTQARKDPRDPQFSDFTSDETKVKCILQVQNQD